MKVNRIPLIGPLNKNKAKTEAAHARGTRPFTD